MRVSTIFRLIGKAPELMACLKGMRNQKILPNIEHLRLCADWLIAAQKATPDDGYSSMYGPLEGWGVSYIETTGYIIPTMFDVAKALGGDRYRRSALRAGRWLLSIQTPEGAFMDLDRTSPQIFDTGQVMFGLNRLYRETREDEYLAASKRAGSWLENAQNPDGSWAQFTHEGKPRTYQTRVAAALIELGKLAGETHYTAAGEKNLRWALSRQRANGYFEDCHLKEGNAALLHTIVYVLEGFWMAYELTRNKAWLEAALKGANPLMKINLNRDLILRSQYDEEFNVVNGEKCVPGLAQWAGLCLDLFGATGEEGYFDAAALTLYYLKSKQLQSLKNLKGALPSSVPFWGHYHSGGFVNWGVKFFVDALLKYQPYGLPVWNEQERWVTACFRNQWDKGSWDKNKHDFEPLDQVIFKKLESYLTSLNNGGLRLLDLGCGEGRYLDRLKRRFPELDLHGIDPVCEKPNGSMRRGSVYELPYEARSFDVVFSFIVFQHLEPDQALKEIRRVLKDKGMLIIGDRDPISGRGFLKPYHEINNKWIYPWDSPFLERWYTRSQWKDLLSQHGFVVKKLCALDNPGDHGIHRLMRMNRFLFIQAEKQA